MNAPPPTRVRGPKSPALPKHRLISHLLTLLVFTLLVEGIVRKLLVGQASDLFLLCKDVIVVLLSCLVLSLPTSKRSHPIRMGYVAFAFCMIPLVLYTALRDPLLAVFGAKQYLLFPMVALAMGSAYAPSSERAFFRVHLLCARWLVPVLLLSLLQLSLPASHPEPVNAFRQTTSPQNGGERFGAKWSA